MLKGVIILIIKKKMPKDVISQSAEYECLKLKEKE